MLSEGCNTEAIAFIIISSRFHLKLGNEFHFSDVYQSLSCDIMSESVIKPCIKNDNPLVD